MIVTKIKKRRIACTQTTQLGHLLVKVMERHAKKRLQRGQQLRGARVLAEGTQITDWLNALGALLSGAATLLAVYFAYRAILVSRDVHESQKLLSQRQLLLPLWQYLAELREIDHNKPIVAQVVRTVNTLELIALCCEAKAVDEQVIKRTFRDNFVRLFLAVEKVGVLDGLGKDGKSILAENRAATKFFLKLKSEDIERDAPTEQL